MHLARHHHSGSSYSDEGFQPVSARLEDNGTVSSNPMFSYPLTPEVSDVNEDRTTSGKEESIALDWDYVTEVHNEHKEMSTPTPVISNWLTPPRAKNKASMGHQGSHGARRVYVAGARVEPKGPVSSNPMFSPPLTPPRDIAEEDTSTAGHGKPHGALDDKSCTATRENDSLYATKNIDLTERTPPRPGGIMLKGVTDEDSDDSIEVWIGRARDHNRISTIDGDAVRKPTQPNSIMLKGVTVGESEDLTATPIIRVKAGAITRGTSFYVDSDDPVCVRKQPTWHNKYHATSCPVTMPPMAISWLSMSTDVVPLHLFVTSFNNLQHLRMSSHRGATASSLTIVGNARNTTQISKRRDD
jgi:hypothetical protein